jgi:predicted amidohydrolase YtcJ
MDHQKSDLILRNGSIYTVDEQRSWAQAIAIAGKEIIQVGSNADIDTYIGAGTEVIDLDGRMVLPGFVDAHAHPSLSMYLFGNINLHSQDSLEIYQKIITEFVDSHPELEGYRGGGWTDGIFPKHGPNKDILDAIVPDRTISLESYDGHSLWVNSLTLERAHITKDTPNPEGGVIEHDPSTGAPSGTLRETAMKLVEGVVPDYSVEQRKQALIGYQEMAAKAGITLVHDAMLEPLGITAFQELEAEGLLNLRFRGAITIQPDQAIEPQIQDLLSERESNNFPNFKILAAKLFVDGVVEGGTAYLLEPYADRPDYRGIPIWKPEALNDVCAALDKENLQIHVHVIGDAAARMTLDALEYAMDLNGKRDARHLITHLQLVTPADILRFKQLGVIGIPQPFWFQADDYYRELAVPYLGKERADIQYPMKSFMEAGVVMASASDFPVTIPFDPVIAIQLGVTRANLEDEQEEILWPAERVDLTEMVASFTYNGAYANFLEDETGSLEVGKQADFVVLDHNLFDLPPVEISRTKVLLTMVAGKQVYRDPGFS